MKFVRMLVRHTHGQDLIEYGLLLGMASAIVVLTLNQIGTRVADLYTTTVTQIADSSAGGASGGDSGDTGGSGGSGGSAAPPTDGLLLWLDATTGVASNSAGLVSRWTDRSGSGFDAAQPADAPQPRLVNVSGLPALECRSCSPRSSAD